ncbi:MAG: putative metal-dependent hydrolase [Candidatus Kapabacteria bacterium]|jgi:hypothetical protein|nr:putative metal-dependent hydrolase [Candidatus Kapabacteria bacterium]
MLTQVERTAHINSIKSLPQHLRSAVQNLTDTQLDTPYRDGGWTVRQVVHHLADSHLNAHTRTRLALTESTPTIKPYNQDAWALLADYALPIEISLQIIDGLHLRWSVLWESLSADAFTRTIHHPDNGIMSLDDILQSYARHGENHVKQIMDLRERKGW